MLFILFSLFKVLDPKSQAVVDRLSLYWDTEFKMKTDNYVREVQLLHANVVNKLVTELAASHNSSNNHPETNIDSMDLSDQNLCEKFHDAMNLEVPKSKIVTPTKSSRSVSIETDTSSGSSAPEHNDTSAGTDENISPKLGMYCYFIFILTLLLINPPTHFFNTFCRST